jgi:hypothetical protein
MPVQFSGRGIIEAKLPEPGGGCNLERSRMTGLHRLILLLAAGRGRISG